MDKKVSILTCVYNGEEYVERYIKSIIEQTYSNIELIIVDDGSSDKTKEIIKKYINYRKEIEIVYLYQENAGQAAAIANGIKHVTGDYLTWADADDYYENDAIEKMATFLDETPKADAVRCNALARNENDLDNISYHMKVPFRYRNKKDIFEDCIFIRGINCFPGVYMIRFDKYKENNPNLYIYVSREGQNWQLLLPAMYNHKCYYLNEYVYNYVIREKSHSHMQRSLDKKMNRENGIKEILKHTIEILNISVEYKTKLFYEIEQMYLIRIYYIYLENNKLDLANKCYEKISKKNIKLKLRNFVLKHDKLYKSYKTIRGLE